MGKAEENKMYKRNALLSHAFLLFMNKGVANTSISDITAGAGVAKGTFYSYFKDKEDLIHKLVAQKGEQLFDHAFDELATQPEMSVDDTVLFIVNDIINQLMNDSKLHKFLNKNILFGLFKRTLIDEGTKENSPFIDKFLEIITKDGDEWSNPLLMLYCIVEFVGSTCYTIILDSEPVSYDSFKPYMFECIKGIMAVYRVSRIDNSHNMK